MKKLLFILCVSFLIGNAFALETENVETESSNIEFVSSSNKAFFARMCCRVTVTNTEGESWSVRRCSTHDNNHIAMGRACEMATDDANRSKERASSYTLTKVITD